MIDVLAWFVPRLYAFPFAFDFLAQQEHPLAFP